MTAKPAWSKGFIDLDDGDSWVRADAVVAVYKDEWGSVRVQVAGDGDSTFGAGFLVTSCSEVIKQVTAEIKRAES